MQNTEVRYQQAGARASEIGGQLILFLSVVLLTEDTSKRTDS